jgi:hypothetical protein
VNSVAMHQQWNLRRSTPDNFVWSAVMDDPYSRSIVGRAMPDHWRSERPLPVLRMAEPCDN